MGETSIANVMDVLEVALKPDDFHTYKAHECKNYNIKLEIMKCGLTKALRELEQQSHLKALYDEQQLNSAGSSSGVTKSDTDIRIKFGEMLYFLLANLAKAIEREKDSTQRNDICELSIGHMDWVRKAIDLLVNVAVRPYLPEGIDKAITDRFWTSNEWKVLLEDKEFQAKQLQTFLTIHFDLMDVSMQVKEFVIRSHLKTVIMAAEVLKHLEHTAFHPRYRTFLSEVTASTVFEEAYSLINRNAEKFGTNWFNRTMITLINEMVGQGHFHDLIHSFVLRGDRGPLDADDIRDMPFVEGLVKGLCVGTPPSMTKKQYLSSLINQFFEHLEPSPRRKKVVVAIFNLFIDQLFKSQKILATTLILDRLLLPLEKLNKGELSEEELRLIPDSIHQLSNLFKYARKDLHSKAVIDRIQNTKLHFLLCAIGFEVNEKMDLDGDEEGEDGKVLRLLGEDLKEIIHAFMHSLPNQAIFLLWVLRQPREILRRIEVKTNPKFVTSKISVIGETRKNPLGRFYFVATKPSTASETGECIRRVVTEICRMQEDKVDLYYSALLEVLKSYINENGYYNRLADLDKADANHSEYIGELVQLANYLFLCIDELDDEHNSFEALEKEETCGKLLNLYILTMTSVVKNMQKEVKEQQKGASLDVKAARSAEEEEHELKLKSAIENTAVSGVAIIAYIPMLRVIAPEKMKRLDPEIDHLLSLVALMKKLMGEMKKLPKEYEALNKAISADGSVDPREANAIFEPSGTMDVNTDVSFFKTDELLDLLNGMAHEKGQGLIMIGRMLMKRNPRLIQIYDTTFHQIVLDLISNGDSYVYLAAINCAAEAALAMTDKIIPFVQMFALVSSVEEKKNAQGEVVSRESIEERVVVRCRIANVICRVFDNLGRAAPLYMRETIDSVMECVDDMHPFIRASSFAVVEHLFRTVAASYSIGAQFEPILQSIEHTLLCEKESQVRRNAIQILPMILRGAGREMITGLSDHLLNINRLLTSILQTEKDQVVIVHALLAKEEIKENLKEKLKEEMTNKVREINL